MNTKAETALPQGYRFSATRCGLKLRKPDIGMVVSEGPAHVAGVFTTSPFAAPCVVRNRRLLPGGSCRAVLVNSANANALNGEGGHQANEALAAEAARVLGLPSEEVLTASTGVLGMELPTVKLLCAMESLRDGLGESLGGFPQCILTTDTCTKVFSRKIYIEGKPVVLTAVGKGSGMVHPNLATILGFVFTDIAAPSERLQSLLRSACEETFNQVSIDGQLSTNDGVFLLANGKSGVDLSRAGEHANGQFESALAELCDELCRAIARDGEGAQRILICTASGPAPVAQLRKLARGVVESPLCKTAMFGADPNWGRILVAWGTQAQRDGIEMSLSEMSLTLQGVPLVKAGEPQAFDRAELRRRLGGEEVRIELHWAPASSEGQPQGAGGKTSNHARAYGCDLSYDYVRINADYSSVWVDPSKGHLTIDKSLEHKTPQLKAEIVLQALRYMEQFRGTRAVIRYGGEGMLRPEIKDRLAEDLRLLKAAGLEPIVVHGSGEELAQAWQMLQSDNRESSAALREDIQQTVLVGHTNRALVGALCQAGARAVGLSGKDAQCLTVASDGQQVRVQRLDPEVIELLLSKGFLPVVAPLAVDPGGRSVSLNPDDFAAHLAVALGARKLIFLDDAAGLQADGLLLSEVSAQTLTRQLRKGQLPENAPLSQLRAALTALSGGVASAHLIDGRVPHNIVAELFTARGVGTMIRTSDSSKNL